jgi:hypothetical protein
MNFFSCDYCGTNHFNKHIKREKHFCSKECYSSYQREIMKPEEHGMWKGGKIHIGGEYTLIHNPSHPMATKDGYVREHRLIAEKAIGKILPKKNIVHHHRQNLSLIICENQAYHLFIHQRERAFKASGHANWRKCKFCKIYDSPASLHIHGSSAYHTECVNLYNRIKKRRHRNEWTHIDSKNVRIVSPDRPHSA